MQKCELPTRPGERRPASAVTELKCHIVKTFAAYGCGLS
jgi:hypothetical protein